MATKDEPRGASAVDRGEVLHDPVVLIGADRVVVLSAHEREMNGAILWQEEKKNGTVSYIIRVASTLAEAARRTKAVVIDSIDRGLLAGALEGRNAWHVEASVVRPSGHEHSF